MKNIFGSIFFWILLITIELFSPGLDIAKAQLADSPWPIFHGNSKLTGQSIYDTSHVDGTILWRFKTDGGIEASPVIDKDGTIYIANQQCNLYAINPDGTQKWKFDGGEPVYSKEWNNTNCTQATPAIASDNTIYFLTMSGYFYAINSDGSEKWRFPMFTFKNIWSSPAIAADGTIYFASEAYPPRESGKSQEIPGYIYALNPDGTKKWEFTTGAAGGSTSVAAIADDGTLYLSSAEMEKSHGTFVGKLFAFNPDGSIKWKYWPQNSVMEGSASIGADGTIYFGVKGDQDPREANFIALNPDGTEKWKVPIDQGESITPAIDKNGNIYFGDWGGKFYAFDKNGKELWRVQTPEAYETLSSSPAIGAEGTLYFGSTTGQLFAYTAEGKEKWQIKVEGGGIIGSPAIGSDGTVYATTVPGELLAIGSSQSTKSSSNTTFINNAKEFTTKNITYIPIIASILASLIIALILRKKLSNQLTINSKKKKIIITLFVVGILLIGSVWSYIMYNNSSSLINPSQSDQNQSQDNTQSQNQIKVLNNGDDRCPHHIYGTVENGFYGAFKDMKTRDLTDNDVEWIKSNCSDTTWPENMR